MSKTHNRNRHRMKKTDRQSERKKSHNKQEKTQNEGKHTES